MVGNGMWVAISRFCDILPILLQVLDEIMLLQGRLIGFLRLGHLLLALRCRGCKLYPVDISTHHKTVLSTRRLSSRPLWLASAAETSGSLYRIL
jgi:hypothetical protein